MRLNNPMTNKPRKSLSASFALVCLYLSRQLLVFREHETLLARRITQVLEVAFAIGFFFFWRFVLRAFGGDMPIWTAPLFALTWVLTRLLRSRWSRTTIKRDESETVK